MKVGQSAGSQHYESAAGMRVDASTDHPTLLKKQKDGKLSKSELDEFSAEIDELTNEEIKATLNWPIFTAGKSLSNVRKAKEVKNTQLILLQKTQNETVILSENIWDKYRNVLGIWMYQIINNQQLSLIHI